MYTCIRVSAEIKVKAERDKYKVSNPTFLTPFFKLSSKKYQIYIKAVEIAFPCHTRTKEFAEFGFRLIKITQNNQHMRA